MDLKLYPIEDLLEELVRRDAIAILQTTQRIEGVKMMQFLGQGDELRAASIAMCQTMMGRTIAETDNVQHIAHRKFQTSRTEEIMVTALLVTKPAIDKLLAKEPVRPDVEPTFHVGELTNG
jgi:hypothetical protein